MLWQGGGDGTVTEQIARIEQSQAGGDGQSGEGSFGFIGLAKATGAARALAGEGARDTASVDPILLEETRMTPEEIRKQPFPNVNYSTRAFSRPIPYKTKAYQNAFTGKISVRFPVGVQSTLPNNTTAYDNAELSQRTRIVLSIIKADLAVQELARRGFRDVESAKHDVTARAMEVLKRENVRNIVDTDILQDW